MNLKTIFKRLILLDLSLFILIIIGVSFESEVVLEFNEIVPATIFNDFSTGPAGVVAAVSLACRGLGLPHSTGRRTGWFP